MPSWTSTLLSSGVTGNGAVTNTTGKYRVVLTTIPAQVGIQLGNPNILHGAGWVYWSESFGYFEAIPIRIANQTFVTPYTGTIQFGWHLAAGVVASIYRMDYV